MSGYWLGVATPFMIVLGILLLWLAGSLFAAIVSRAWKKAHYGLLKKGWIAEDYDEDSREWTTRPGAERLAAALFESLRDGGLESFKVDSAALRWRIDEFKSIVDGRGLIWMEVSCAW